jgi:phosphatidylglycerophosphate synthase
MTDAETPEPPVPETPKNRRPLTSRNTAWARGLTERAIKAGLTPNQISRLGIGFAALGMVFYTLSPYGPGILQWLFLILAAATCQARLVCNLIDGMVAVEGGQGAKDGPFWNEAPDRLSDFFFFIGAGLAAGNAALGTLAAALAIAAAYIRELGRAEGFAPDFSGPMAKQHRMAVLSIGSVLAAFYGGEWTLGWVLWIIVLGTAITIASRSVRLISALATR